MAHAHPAPQPSDQASLHVAVPHVIVVGGGWSGLAAALELTTLGAAVTLLERARALGGRARALTEEDSDASGRFRLDNGQHILLGAYRTCLDLMRQVGISPETALLRLPLQIRYADGFALAAIPGGRPWHLFAGLWQASGIPLGERLRLVRKLAVTAMGGWHCHHDLTVAQWLARESTLAVERIWQPLCVSALNTPIEEASAQVFVNVLRDALLSGPGSSDMLVPRVDFGTLFAEPAARWLDRHHSHVLTAKPVRELIPDASGWTAVTSAGAYRGDGVVLATSPRAANRLLHEIPLSDPDSLGVRDALCSQLAALAYAPITTVYLPDPGIRLPHPMLALRCNPSAGAFGQFLFDRGQLSGPATAADDGYWAVVISVADDAAQLPRADLAAAVCRQVAQELGDMMPAGELATRLQAGKALVITEKQATFRSRPRVCRPGTATGIPGLVLAGDYIAGPYPATLEGAVQSGLQAARTLWAQLAGR